MPHALDPFYPIVESADWVARLLAQGVRLVQLRVKEQPPAIVHSEIARAKALCDAAGAQLVVNDFWRAAIELQCAYVHLGQEDLAAADLVLDAEDLAAIDGEFPPPKRKRSLEMI